MEKQDINIEIAIIMGFSAPKGTWTFGGRAMKIPDYAEDLNAMHEAEKTFWPIDDSTKWDEYAGHIYEITEHGCCSEHQNTFRMLNASAADRAEAFLRTFDKWEEGK